MEDAESRSIHRCSCGATFDDAEKLREHAREEHDAVV
jgi:hypothetical protein